MTEPTTLRWKVTGGVELVGAAYGNPADPPVLLLHGGGRHGAAGVPTSADLDEGGGVSFAVVVLVVVAVFFLGVFLLDAQQVAIVLALTAARRPSPELSPSQQRRR